MSLEQQISKGIMEAMKAKDTVRLSALRNAKKYIIEAKTAGPEIAELPDADVLKIISKLAKQGTDSAAIFSEQNRPDLASEELAQVAVFQEFLPRQLTPEELTAEVKALIAEVGATSMKEMGKVMGVASKRLAGRADGNVKTVAMPTAMVVGALLCRPISALEELSGQMITPTLIFLMLFVTFCRVKPSQMKPSMLHVWLLLVQTVACIGVFLLLRPLDLILAQGAMVCVLAPVAMAAVVIGGMLGANVATMATYSLLCNMAVALLAPVILTFTGTGACTFAQILARIAPLLVMPFAAAQFCRLVIPKAAKWVGDHSQISFYMWLASLLVIIGRTTAFIIDLRDASLATELWLAFAALAICLGQFKVGRMLGRRYGDAPAGGQSLGQKNTVLAVWMAQSFLDPISSIAPTAYIVWQNFVNSYQIWRKDRGK